MKFEVEQLGYALGAAIRILTCASRSRTRDGRDLRAMAQHQVLVFPGQQELTAAQHMAFASRFGTLDKHNSQPRLTWILSIRNC